MKNKIELITNEINDFKIEDATTLENFRIHFLGSKGIIKDLFSELKAVPNEEKREVMQNLLESVQTSRLKGAFEKYLPAVLNDAQPRARKNLSESVRSVTGDKTVKAAEEEDRSNVIDIKRLAGL